MKTDDQLYTITLTGKQALMFADACELVGRLGIGQWREALRHMPLIDNIRTYALEEELYPIISKYFPPDLPKNGSYGVSNDKSVPLSDDYLHMNRIIRHRLAWDRKPEGDIFVEFDTPRPFGKETQPDIRIEKA